MKKNFYYEEILNNMFKLLDQLKHKVPNEFIEATSDLIDDVIKLEAIIYTLLDLIKDKE